MKQITINCPTFRKWKKLESVFPFAPVEYENTNVIRACLEWQGDDKYSAEYLRDVVLIPDAIKLLNVDVKDIFD